MNEITRIHLAKTPYDIEILAKKDLESYLRKIKLYVDDEDSIVDIELRMTEILADRGVLSGGVVVQDDVDAIKKQLGDPKDFLEDDEVSSGEIEEQNRHRLYRDTDGAILGGVLSGVAEYFGISPIWPRLVFVLLILLSAGTAFVVYVVLWIVVPPARTMSEKLQLRGKPVTVSSLKQLRDRTDELEYNGNDEVTKFFKSAIFYSLGTMMSIFATISLVVTIWFSLGLVFGTSYNSPYSYWIPGSFLTWSALVLFIISGLLLTAMFAIFSFALFARKFTKIMGISIVLIILMGIITFSTGVGVVRYGYFEECTIHQVGASRELGSSVNFNISERINGYEG